MHLSSFSRPALFCQSKFDFFMNMLRFHDSLIGSFRRIMFLDGFRTDSFFFDKFYRREEEVVKETPFVAIEVVQQRHNPGIV